MKTGHIVILVLGLGVVALLIMRQKKVTAQSGTTYSINLGGVISSIGGLFQGGKTTPPGYSNAPTVPSNFDTNNYTTSQGFEFTDSSGNFIAG